MSMPSGRRRFTILDGLVLIAATAVGLAGSMAVFNGPFYKANSFLAFEARFLKRWDAVFSYAEHLGFVASPFLMAWTLAIGVLALAPPRRRVRRMARLPGVAACWAASIALAASLLLEATSWHRSGANFDGFLDWGLPSAFRPTGCAVLAAWGVMAMSGRLRAEPVWLDRLGRLFGVLWVIAMPLPAWSVW